MQLSKTLTLILFCFTSAQLLAMVKDSTLLRKNSIYYELGGNGIKQSINYDRLISWEGKNFKNIFRIGLGYNGSPSADTVKWSSKIIVSEITFVLKNRNLSRPLESWELGFGYSYHLEPIKYYEDKILKERVNWAVGFMRIGYRVQSARGILLRIGITPTLSHDLYNYDKYLVGLYGGISLGYSFNLQRKKISTP